MVASPERHTTPALIELQPKKQWVCWCYEHDANGNLTKVPYAPSGYKADTTDSTTWSTYKDVVEAQATRHNKFGKSFDGIGFVFNKDYTGIDCDHCLAPDGSIDQWALDILHQIGSFADKSPNDGIHIFVKAVLPPESRHKFYLKDMRHEKAAVEIYCQGRFFTWTGNHVDSTPETIEPRQTELDALYQDLLARRQKPPTEKPQIVPAHPIDLSDTQLIEKASNAANGVLFAALWRGDTSDYPSQSEADQALCNLLAFWTGKDVARMDDLFRRSGLYREEKWDRNARSGETYGQGTIERAVFNCRETYNPTYQKELDSSLINEIEEQLRKEREKPEEQSCEEATNKQEKKKIPEIVIEGQLRTLVRNALLVLKMKNEKDVRLFVFLSTISKIEYDEHGNPIIMRLEKAALRNELSTAADFKAWKKVGKETILVDAHPPKDLAEQIIALAPRKWGFPPLKGITEIPVLCSDGSIIKDQGYDENTGLYYIPSPEMKRCRIPENPTQQDAIEAMNRIEGLFADFPFEEQADYANMIALLFTPFIRYAVKKDIQMALIDATNAGTGKGLLTIVVSIIATGRQTTPMSAKQSEEEWRKALFSELLQAPRIIIIDNVRGPLESSTLELILTGGGITDRILGHSKSASPKNSAVIMVTGNNLVVAGDLPRRCMRVRLISELANPEERTDFEIPDLEQHVTDNRPEIISDILCVASSWYAAGKPQPANVPNLGTFTDWAKTVGGMLEYAGVEGFQANRGELRSKNNEEAQQWEAFLSALHAKYEEVWNTAGAFDKEIKDQSEKAKENNGADQPPATLLFDALPLDLKKALADKPSSFAVTLARQLGARIQTVYGSPGYRIERGENSHSKQNLWRVTRVVAGGSTSRSKFRKKSEAPKFDTPTDSTVSTSSPEITEKINDQIDHPQPPATTAEKKPNESQDASSNGSTGGSRPIEDKSIESDIAGSHLQVAGGLNEQPSQSSSTGRMPTEYLVIFTDYKMKIDSLPVDTPIWRAPDSGHPCNREMLKEKHIQFTKELLCSGVDRRVNAAVEAMHRTLGTWDNRR